MKTMHTSSLRIDRLIIDDRYDEAFYQLAADVKDLPYFSKQAPEVQERVGAVYRQVHILFPHLSGGQIGRIEADFVSSIYTSIWSL